MSIPEKSVNHLNFIATQKINNTKIQKYIIPKLPKYQKSVRNRKTKHYSTNTVLWEHTYFNHILNLKKIFASFVNINTNTSDFLQKWCIFLRKCSTGEISNYMEDISPFTENLYFEFMVKRNNNIPINE